MRAAINVTARRVTCTRTCSSRKKSPARAGLKPSIEQNSPALFAAGVLMLLVRRPLTGPLVALRGRLLRAALAAGRGLARAFVVLRRRMLPSCAALTAILAAGRGLTCALVLLRGRLLRTCATLAGR